MPPQVDIETLVSACAGGGATDRKVACETLAGDDGVAKDAPPDFPPGSFCLSKDAEIDWFDQNAFLERKESAKGINANQTGHPNLNPGPNSSSQRFVKPKASLLGFPKTQKMNYVWKTCTKPASIRLFPPKRSESIEKTAAEPGSPKVSCMGRVRSKRGCRKSASTRESSAGDRTITVGNKDKIGFYSRLLSLFKPNRRLKPAPKLEDPDPDRNIGGGAKKRDAPISVELAAEPPGLGAVRRLSSARKPDSWAAEEIKNAISGSFETGRRRSHTGVADVYGGC
ncbi:unnamed protein product [Cuscuta campestris]|uniref:Uncharacterized protein n=1 Tax=Cuscuta campestris TaxID=132261 RepID=A0A484K3B5_9ASTE|nr:unnamed protein product [Cuscuta campestris]